MSRRLSLAAGALTLLACRGDLDAPAARASLNEPFFHCKVQPVLSKSCSMFACHGDGARYFRQYTRNRLRYGITKESERNAKLNDHERRFNFEAALAYIDPDAVGESLLLKKILPPSAGGFYHGGTKYGGGNVFVNADDPEYRVIVDWTKGATADPSCIAPGEDQ